MMFAFLQVLSFLAHNYYDLSAAHLIGALKYLAVFCSTSLICSHLTFIVGVHIFYIFLMYLKLCTSELCT